jgi:hypothetical protein
LVSFAEFSVVAVVDLAKLKRLKFLMTWSFIQKGMPHSRVKEMKKELKIKVLKLKSKALK